MTMMCSMYIMYVLCLCICVFDMGLPVKKKYKRREGGHVKHMNTTNTINTLNTHWRCKMESERNVKVEASLPVQARVDVRTLAGLSEYLKSEGMYIDSMSKLVSWSLDLLHEILVSNDRLKIKYLSFTDAYDYLMERGLYQPGVGKGGSKKAQNSRRFESMRLRGINPVVEAKEHYNLTHNKHSVQTSGFSAPVIAGVDATKEAELDDIWERAQKDIRDEKAKERAKKGPDTSEIVPQIMSPGLDTETYNRLMAEPATGSNPVKFSDMPRSKTDEENEEEALEIEKEDRLMKEKLKNM